MNKLAVAQLEEIDKICDEFESALLSGQSPPVKKLIESADAASRVRLIKELIAIDHDHSRRNGRECSLDRWMDAIEDDETKENISAWYTAQGSSSAVPKAVRSLGKFKLVRQLGSGGQGTVWEARNTDTDRRVALKLLNNISHSEDIRRFCEEAKILGRLREELPDHGICEVYDAGPIADRYFISMELIEGESLASMLKLQREQGAPVDYDRCADLVCRIAATLSAVHSAGCLHRDLKPANIMLRRDGRPVVVDFGVARALDGELTRSRGEVGTPHFMSPEQMPGNAGQITAATDVYGLGLILCCLLRGDPLPGERPVGTETWKVPEAVPGALAELVRQMTDPDPGKRPSMEDVAQRLQRPVDMAAPRVKPGRARQGTRKPVFAVVAALAALLLIACGVIIINTRVGELMIRINDSDFVLKIDEQQHKYQISHKDGEWIVIKPIRVANGEHTLKILRNGLEAETRKFTLRRGEQVVIDVTLRTRSYDVEDFEPSWPIDRFANVHPLHGLVPLPAKLTSGQRWGVESKHPRKRFYDIAFSPDGQWLATCGAEKDALIRLYRRITGQLQLVRLYRSRTTLQSLDWHPDGKRLIFRQGIADAGHFSVVNVEVLEEEPLRIPVDNCWFPQWSPAGTRLAFYTRLDSPDGLDRRYQLRVGSSDEPGRVLLESATSAGFGMTWHPDGRRMLAVSGDDLFLIAVDAEEPVVARTTIKGLGSQQASIGVNSTGKLVAIATPAGLTVRKIDQLDDDFWEHDLSDARGLCWHPEVDQLFVLRYGLMRFDFEQAEESPVASLLIPDNQLPGAYKYCLFGGNDLNIVAESAIYRCDMTRGSCDRILGSRSHDGYSAMTFSPDGSRCATLTPFGLNILSPAGLVLKRVPLDEDPISLEWSPDGRTIAVRAQQVTLVDVESGRRRRLDIRQARDLGWHPTSRYLFVATDDEIHVADLNEDLPVTKAATKRAEFWNLAVNKSGTRVAASAADSVQVWLFDPASPQLKHFATHPMQRPEKAIGLRFLEGNRLVELLRNGQLIEVETGKQLWKYDADSFTEHRTAAWSADGKLLAYPVPAERFASLHSSNGAPHGRIGETAAAWFSAFQRVALNPRGDRLLASSGAGSEGPHISCWQFVEPSATWLPLWFGIVLPQGRLATFTVAGEPISADEQTLQQDLVFFTLDNPDCPHMVPFAEIREQVDLTEVTAE